MARRDPHLFVRMPSEVKAFLDVQAAFNASSRASEVVRALREKMARMGEPERIGEQLPSLRDTQQDQG